MKYVLELSKLRPGDVILTSEQSKTSKAVRLGTFSKYSHAVLYIDYGSCVHSDSIGVRARNPQRLLFKSEKSVAVLRLKNELLPEELYKITEYVRLQIGKCYSVRDAVSSKLPLQKDHNSNRQFCSRLVAEAYLKGGINLVDTGVFCTPKDLINSELLEELQGVVKEANFEEIEFAKSFDPIEQQGLIMQGLLSEVQNLTGKDLQTTKQIIDFLIQNRSFDNEISKIFRESEYMDHWRFEYKQNPWRYSSQKFMEKFPKSEHADRAKSENFFAQNFRVRRIKSLEMLKNLNQLHNLEFIDLQIEIEHEMISLCDALIGVCYSILEE